MISPNFLGLGGVAISGAPISGGTPKDIYNQLAVVAASYTLTGNTTGLYPTRRIGVTTGVYTQTGNTLVFTKVLILSLTTGVYTQTGVSNLLKASRLLSMAAGSYTITGRAIPSSMYPFAGSYESIGIDVSFTVSGVPQWASESGLTNTWTPEDAPT